MISQTVDVNEDWERKLSVSVEITAKLREVVLFCIPINLVGIFIDYPVCKFGKTSLQISYEIWTSSKEICKFPLSFG